MIPIHVINLDRSPERLLHMRAELERLGLPFERLRAVDGGVDPTQTEPHKLTANEVACFQSHRLVWERIAASDNAFALVLEDDVVLHETILPLLEDGAWVPAGVEAVKLETNLESVHLGRVEGLAHGFELRNLRSPHWGTGGYILRRDAAPRLLALSETITRAVDVFLYLPAHLRRSRGLPPVQSVQCIPAPVIATCRTDDGPELASLIGERRDARFQEMRDKLRSSPRHRRTRIPREAARFYRRLVRWFGPAVTTLRGHRLMRVPFADGRTAKNVDGASLRPCAPGQPPPNA